MGADEGVEFFIELNAKLDEATKMVRELTKTEAAALKADAALKKAEKQTGLLGRAFHGAGEKAAEFAKETLAHFTALASFEGLSKIAEGLFDVGKEALQAAGEAERTRTSFRLLMGIEPADDLLDWIDDIAKHTEFTDGALKSFAAQLIRTGFSGEGLHRALAATLDLAALAPEKLGGAADAVALLGKVNLKGGVSERELVSAGLSPAKVFQRLADELHIGVKGVQKELEAGKIKTDVLLEALYSEVAAKTKKPLGGAGVEVSNTFLARVEKVKDIVPNLFEELEKSGGLKNITAALGNLAGTLDPGSATGAKIVKGLTQMLDAFANLVTKVDIEKFAASTTAFLERLPKLIDLSITALEKLLSLSARLLPNLPTAPDSAAGLAVRKQIRDEKTDHPVLNWFAQVLKPSSVDPLQADREGHARLAAQKTGAAVGEGMAAGIKATTPAAVDATFSMLDEIKRAPVAELEIHSPSRVFRGHGRNLGLGVMEGLADVQPRLEQQFTEVFGSIAEGRAFSAPRPMALPPIGAGGNTNSLEANVTVNIGSAASDDDGAREQADMAGAAVTRAIETLFERWAAQGGAS